MKNSAIEWTDHTFNPWIGCTEVSPGCARCYAKTLNKRWRKGANWGKGAPRERTSAANWREPLKWDIDSGNNNAALTANGYAPDPHTRVFCASLADWLDDEVPIEWLADLLKLIHDTPNLDWQLLTKRPENWRRRLERVSELFRLSHDDVRMPWATSWLEGDAPANVWIGTSVEDQQRADLRIPQLLAIPARVRFLSCEPLLEEVSLDVVGQPGEEAPDGTAYDLIHWVICGGESGRGARPMHPAWARGLRDQCQGAGVPFFFKQWGENLPFDNVTTRDQREAFSKCVLRITQSYFGACVVQGPDGPKTGTTLGIRPISFAPVGKKIAGRLLDGREWSEFPQVNIHA